MGACTSCEVGAAAAGAMWTAKVIHSNGELEEFDHPVKASNILEKDGSGFFVCDADEMEIGGYVTAVRSDGELRTGQIYFVLPRSMLKRRICGEDLAALAVKASRAVTVSFVFSEGVLATERRRRGMGSKFASDLSVILE